MVEEGDEEGPGMEDDRRGACGGTRRLAAAAAAAASARMPLVGWPEERWWCGGQGKAPPPSPVGGLVPVAEEGPSRSRAWMRRDSLRSPLEALARSRKRFCMQWLRKARWMVSAAVRARTPPYLRSSISTCLSRRSCDSSYLQPHKGGSVAPLLLPRPATAKPRCKMYF